MAGLSPSSPKHAKLRFTASGYIKWLEAAPGRLVAAYLIHSFLYYRLHTTVVSDDVFDRIVEALSRRWDDITHPHKALLDREFLKSGFHIDEYPEIVQGAARMALRGYLEVN